MENPLLPAFPVDEETTDRIDEGIFIYSGLTKREYFAAKSMQGLLANSETGYPIRADVNPVTIATGAIAYADALLNELEK